MDETILIAAALAAASIPLLTAMIALPKIRPRWPRLASRHVGL